MFQSPQVFVDGKGCKGLQEQVLLRGGISSIRASPTIELVDMTEVPIAHVGVAIAYVGQEGKDVQAMPFGMEIRSIAAIRASGWNRWIPASIRLTRTRTR
jgi:hypothetical protein